MTSIEETNTEETNTEETIKPADLLIIKAGDSKISKTIQIKPQPERPAVEYRAAIVGSQEITITVKDEVTAIATIDRLLREGYSATCNELDESNQGSESSGNCDGAGVSDSVETDGSGTVTGANTGTDAPGTVVTTPCTLRVSLEPGKENLAAFRDAFKLTKHKDHGNKEALDAAQQSKIDAQAAANAAKLLDREKKAAEKVAEKEEKKAKADADKAAKAALARKKKEEKDATTLDAIKNKERDRVLKEKHQENQRLEVRIKQDEATLEAIKRLIKARGFSSPEADEEVEQRVAAIAADKETLSMNKRAIKKEEEARQAEAPDTKEELVVKDDPEIVIVSQGGVKEGVEDLVEDTTPDLETTVEEDDLDGFGPDLDTKDDGPTDGDFLAGM